MSKYVPDARITSTVAAIRAWCTTVGAFSVGGGAWDALFAQTVATMLEQIADTHRNTPLETSSPRGYCALCGGYSGRHCGDVAAALNVCETWPAP